MRFFFWLLLIFLMGVYAGIVITDFIEFIAYDDNDEDENF